ncbi:hypothetical protein SASPL_126015 [Salvia splendens]|uniref:Uncharacterized protein n=1 Tax=Salvia splendens TaxID=180675 RepID=A0A8X8ZQQ6_SALSN|nr:hypothetical protein SASPL_126015 [Salvia splendens]
MAITASNILFLHEVRIEYHTSSALGLKLDFNSLIRAEIRKAVHFCVYRGKMGEVKDNEVYEEELLDYEEEEEKAPDSANGKPSGETVKKGYVGIHSSGFRDFLLKPELLRAIVDSGFEHPSEGRHLPIA